MTLFGGRVVVPLSGETKSYFYTLVIIYLWVCSLNLYTQLYVCVLNVPYTLKKEEHCVLFVDRLFMMSSKFIKREELTSRS
jgi:hypothetical protein